MDRSEFEELNFVTLRLCLVLLGVYVIQIVTGFDPAFQAGNSAWWKFFTSILGHSGPKHLFNNLFFLGLFGTVLELRSSTKNFLFVFFASALFANLTAFFFYSGPIIGASGGAMGVLAALAVYRPNQIGLALGIPLPMWSVLGIYILIQMAGLTGYSNTAYMAHLFGLVIGAAVGYRMRDRSLIPDLEVDEEEREWKKRMREWEEKFMMN
jgi:membrane associated rhomboid family serine protease